MPAGNGCSHAPGPTPQGVKGQARFSAPQPTDVAYTSDAPSGDSSTAFDVSLAPTSVHAAPEIVSTDGERRRVSLLVTLRWPPPPFALRRSENEMSVRR